MCLTAPAWKHGGISDWKNSHSSIYPRANSQTPEGEKQTVTEANISAQANSSSYTLLGKIMLNLKCVFFKVQI